MTSEHRFWASSGCERRLAIGAAGRLAFLCPPQLGLMMDLDCLLQSCQGDAVCSGKLVERQILVVEGEGYQCIGETLAMAFFGAAPRSEERRVGKECRSRGVRV